MFRDILVFPFIYYQSNDKAHWWLWSTALSYITTPSIALFPPVNAPGHIS